MCLHAVRPGDGRVMEVVGQVERMTEVKVLFFSMLRELFQGKETHVRVEQAPTVGALLDLLCDTAERRKSLFADPGTLRPRVTILLNGRNVALLDSLATPLREGDQVSIFPPLAGG